MASDAALHRSVRQREGLAATEAADWSASPAWTHAALGCRLLARSRPAQKAAEGRLAWDKQTCPRGRGMTDCDPKPTSRAVPDTVITPANRLFAGPQACVRIGPDAYRGGACAHFHKNLLVMPLWPPAAPLALR
jgi:hypothetical protein